MEKLDAKVRYLQIAFNYDMNLVRRVVPTLPASDRVFLEAGTPYVKREGMDGVRAINRFWSGQLVADMKTIDGAEMEVDMAHSAGATAVTVLGDSPTEALDFFVDRCEAHGVLSMIDMLGVDDPLDTLMRMAKPPDVVVLHRGRDEEQTEGKKIQYRHVTRVRSKFDVVISAAGGVDLKEARSAIFNGANMVVVNLVRPGDPWEGISTEADVAQMVRKFLETIR